MLGDSVPRAVARFNGHGPARDTHHNTMRAVCQPRSFLPSIVKQRDGSPEYVVVRTHDGDFPSPSASRLSVVILCIRRAMSRHEVEERCKSLSHIHLRCSAIPGMMADSTSRVLQNATNRAFRTISHNAHARAEARPFPQQLSAHCANMTEPPTWRMLAHRQPR